MVTNLLRQLPNVDELLKRDSVINLVDRLPRQLVLDVIREVLDARRQALLGGEEDAGLVAVDGIARAVEDGVERRLTPGLNGVINALGVVLHTNLGRAPLGRDFLRQAVDVAAGYSNLEYDLAARQRGSRYTHTTELLRELTGAEASLVVNNNAAAMVVMLAALARGREAIVSRGELIEIGGSFRLPEIFEAGGVRLVEVGTTNRTHLKDYENAIGPNTAMLLKVHRSNFAIVGFTKEIEAEELGKLGAEHNLPVCEDLGSGCLVDLTPWGINSVTAAQQVARGLDLVTFSGDKMLGGPQAGIIVGRADLIARIKANPLTRALRVDKLTLATLERTLLSYVDGSWRERVPIMAMLTASAETLLARAQSLAAGLKKRLGESATVQIEDSEGRVGGGALPQLTLAGKAVRITPTNKSVVRIERELRAGTPAILGRLDANGLVLEVRTLFDADIPIVIEQVASSILE